MSRWFSIHLHRIPPCLDCCAQDAAARNQRLSSELTQSQSALSEAQRQLEEVPPKPAPAPAPAPAPVQVSVFVGVDNSSKNGTEILMGRSNHRTGTLNAKVVRSVARPG